jgi:hypothetical protein
LFVVFDVSVFEKTQDALVRQQLRLPVSSVPYKRPAPPNQLHPACPAATSTSTSLGECFTQLHTFGSLSALTMSTGLHCIARLPAAQGDLFKPNHYLSLHAFRELTLKRLQAFVAAKFSDGNGGAPAGFDVRDYLNSEYSASRWCAALCHPVRWAGPIRQTTTTTNNNNDNQQL